MEEDQGAVAPSNYGNNSNYEIVRFSGFGLSLEMEKAKI